MNKSINAAAQVNAQQYMHTNRAHAICFMGHAQLTVMAKTLIPEQAEAILKEYADAFNWKEVRVSEVDLVAERTAAGKAGIKGKTQNGDKGGSGSGSEVGSETKEKKGAQSEKQGISEAEALKQSFGSGGMSLNKARELQEVKIDEAPAMSCHVGLVLFYMPCLLMLLMHMTCCFDACMHYVAECEHDA